MLIKGTDRLSTNDAFSTTHDLMIFICLFSHTHTTCNCCRLLHPLLWVSWSQAKIYPNFSLIYSSAVFWTGVHVPLLMWNYSRSQCMTFADCQLQMSYTVYKLLYFVFFHAMLDLLSKVCWTPVKSSFLFVRALILNNYWMRFLWYPE